MALRSRLFPLQVLAPCALVKVASALVLALVHRQQQLQLLPPLSICFVFFFCFHFFLVSYLVHYTSEVLFLHFTALVVSPLLYLRVTASSSLPPGLKVQNHRQFRIGQIMPLCRITLVNRIFKIPIKYTVHTRRTNNNNFFFAGMLLPQIVTICAEFLPCILLCLVYVCMSFIWQLWHAISVLLLLLCSFDEDLSINSCFTCLYCMYFFGMILYLSLVDFRCVRLFVIVVVNKL